MLKKCPNCGKEFEGNERKFCSWQCDESGTKALRLNKTLKDDAEQQNGTP